MAASSPHQLLLLADDLKLSLLERQRAMALNLEPTKQDNHISRSLTNLQTGLAELEANSASTKTPDSDLSKLRQQFSDLYAQFHGSAPPTTELTRPNDPALAEDFAAARSIPVSSRRNKNVRFRDNPNADEDDEDNQANRAALFSDTQRYRDEPEEAPDHSALDNQQIHTYHKNVLREQDEQLEVLGQSIGRQRLLGIQMGNELDEQNELLDDVEAGVDRHSNTLDRAQKRLGIIARKSKDNWNWITIGILIVVLVLLIIILK